MLHAFSTNARGKFRWHWTTGERRLAFCWNCSCSFESVYCVIDIVITTAAVFVWVTNLRFFGSSTSIRSFLFSFISSRTAEGRHCHHPSLFRSKPASPALQALTDAGYCYRRRDVAWSLHVCVSLFAFLPHEWAAQKRTNQSRCRLDEDSRGPKEPCHFRFKLASFTNLFHHILQDCLCPRGIGLVLLC